MASPRKRPIKGNHGQGFLQGDFGWYQQGHILPADIGNMDWRKCITVNFAGEPRKVVIRLSTRRKNQTDEQRLLVDALESRKCNRKR